VLLVAMKTKIVGAKIACLDMNLMKARMHLGVHITIDDPEQLEAIRKRYAHIKPTLVHDWH
jgi:T-complex protein 1 subunit alpha